MGATPRYQRIKDEILARISAGTLAVGARLPTELQLSQRYKVSRPTIRQALLVLQNEGYLERVQGRGTFVIPPRAGSGGQGGAVVMEVGFVVPRLADLFVGKIVTGAQEVLAENGYHVSVFITKDDVSKEGAVIRGLLDKRVAGIIVHPTMSPYYNPIMYALAEKRVPFVMTGRHYRFLDCSYVEADNARGAYEAVSHLIGLGHRNIGLVSKPIGIKSSAEDRVNGYLAAMADHDLPVRGKLMLTDLPDRRSVYWDERTAEEIAMVMGRLRVYLQSAPELTAVIALNDLIAADIIQAVREAGRMPGADVSVVGFDNVSLSERLDPSLTTVESPILEMGRAAARVLLDRIARPEAEPQRLQLPVKLVIRESSKPCCR